MVPGRTTLPLCHQRQRINQAEDFILNNLIHKHSVEELAALSNYSPFHFLRLFQRFTRQTPMQFVTNQRLDRAARLLAYNSKISVTDTGISCGFSSSQHLSKSFKSAFGLSPSDASGNLQFLDNRTTPVVGADNDKAVKTDYFSVNGGNRARVEVVELPDYHVGYSRTVGPYNPQTLEEWFDRMVEWIGSSAPSSTMFGVPRSLPAITPHWRCVHEVCGVLPGADNRLAPGMNSQILSGGPTAIYRADIKHRSLYVDCRRIWTWLTHRWLPFSSFQPDDRPAFEVYTRHSQGTSSQTIEFCLPVRQRQDLCW